MGRQVGQPEIPEGTGGTFTISLFGPGMTLLHRVGLAGLWMTLEALEHENSGSTTLLGQCGSWERTETSVTLRWHRGPRAFFNALFQRSFRIDNNGLIWLPGLGLPMDNPQHAVVLHEAILGSFLQHGQTRRADPARKPQGNMSVEIDGTGFPLKFHRVARYSHQYSAFSARDSNRLAGWHYPGAAVRHTGLGQQSTALEEPPERALALRFAPVGAVYFEIRSRGGRVRPRYSLVLPEIRNLEEYSQARRAFLRYGIQQLYAAGTAEAGLRVLAELEAATLLQDVASAYCRVISFGTVPWASQQKTRVNLMTVRVESRSALRTFTLCRQLFKVKLVKQETADAFWSIPQTPDLVAYNLTNGRLWWEGFADFVADKLRRKHIFRYEKGGLVQMVGSKQAFPEGPQHTFVLACHEAWRRRMGKLGEKAKREGSPFHEQVRREFERLRVGFARCKNAASLREAVTDFWARGGGPLKPLQDGWRDVLMLLDEKHWREARDLVLLALASYKPATKEEAEALDGSEANEAKGGE